MSEIKVNSVKGVGASSAALTIHNSDGTCTLSSGSKLNNCTTDGTTNLTIADGNLVISTSGHGIDFSATSGTGTSELFTDYEEGTFSATGADSGGTQFSSGLTGKYTKIGNTVFVSIFFFAYGGTSNKTMGHFSNLPFAAISEPHATGVICRTSGGDNVNIEHEESCYIAQGGTQIRMKGNYGTGSSKNNTLSLTYRTAS